MGLNEGFGVGFKVGEREDGRAVGFLVGRIDGFTELGACEDGMVVAIAIGD